MNVLNLISHVVVALDDAQGKGLHVGKPVGGQSTVRRHQAGLPGTRRSAQGIAVGTALAQQVEEVKRVVGRLGQLAR
ncbi:MAG: hypothetical protein IJT48_12210, partial [Bacteroidaceae bacterium]|nr:hypothetical protein [Bacteroidaceae bacterium]